MGNLTEKELEAIMTPAPFCGPKIRVRLWSGGVICPSCGHYMLCANKDVMRCENVNCDLHPYWYKVPKFELVATKAPEQIDG